MSSLPKNDYSRTIVTVMKNEAPYMLDWISYHLAIGFTHFVILTNDCSDGTEVLARKLAKTGVITYKNNPAPHPKGPQKTGYNRMRKLEAFNNATWLLSLDVDEYFRIDVGDGTLDALFEFMGEKIKAVSFVWQIFGNNQIREIKSQNIDKLFTHSQHPLQSRPYETCSIKTLYQAKYFERIGTHRPVDIRHDQVSDFFWIDADGVPMIQYYLQRHWRAYENGLGFGGFLGRVNHYALRSLDGFMVKWNRGFVHPNAPTVRGKGTPLDYWKLFNWNQYLETRPLRQFERRAEILEELTQLSGVKKFVESGVNWHRDRAKTLRLENPEIYKSLEEMGSSSIDEVMPDFSKYGSPKSSFQRYISPQILVRKAIERGQFDEELIKSHYEGILLQ